LPAGAVRWLLADPRRIPYLFLWKSERDGEVKEAVRVAQCGDPGPFYGTNREFFRISRGAYYRSNWVTVKRTDGSCEIVRTIWRPLPRKGGRDLLLVCPGCQTLRRFLYGWEASGPYTNSADRSIWLCRVCARLRYCSEGGYLRALWRNLPRPQPWLPYVFTSIDDPRLDGIEQSSGE